MRAVRIDGSRTVDLAEVPIPATGADEVLVRVAFAGLCATDRRLAARGSDPPRIPGHEIAGELEDGSPVGIHPDVGCHACPSCAGGFENRCPDRVSIGLGRDGGLAEWVAVPRRHAVVVDGVAPEDATLLEPLACCLHAVRLLDVQPGTAALVVGAGPMGILAMWALQAHGARVAVCQRSVARRRLSAELGADGVLGPDGDPSIVLGEPPTAAVVTAPGPEALGWALERVDTGGRVHAFAGSSVPFEIDANLIHYRHLTLVGSTGSGLPDYHRARSLAIEGTVDLSRLPRTVISLDEAAVALRTPEAVPFHKTIVAIGRPAAA